MRVDNKETREFMLFLLHKNMFSARLQHSSVNWFDVIQKNVSEPTSDDICCYSCRDNLSIKRKTEWEA